MMFGRLSYSQGESHISFLSLITFIEHLDCNVCASHPLIRQSQGRHLTYYSTATLLTALFGAAKLNKEKGNRCYIQ